MNTTEPLIWRISEDYDDALMGVYDRARSPDRFVYRDCRPAARFGVPRITFQAAHADLQALDVLGNDAQLPLINARAQAILESVAGDCIEFIDTEVSNNSGVETSSWKVLNVLRCVHAIDHEQSEYSKVRGTDRILRFRKLRYRADALGSTAIARDAEYKGHILVAASLASIFREAGIRGVEFATADQATL